MASGAAIIGAGGTPDNISYVNASLRMHPICVATGPYREYRGTTLLTDQMKTSAFEMAVVGEDAVDPARANHFEARAVHQARSLLAR